MGHDHEHEHGHSHGPAQEQPPMAPVGTGVSLTEKAAKKLLEFMAMEKKDPATTALRVGLVGGGCSGFQYMLDFDVKKDGDFEFESNGAKVLVDGKSIMYMRGSVIDYEETVMGAGFKVNNPRVKSSCGCGSSVGF